MPLQYKRSWMDCDGLQPLAAWQPLGAPSFQDSLWDWRKGFASGVVPLFRATNGWTFTGTNWLDTDIYPSTGYTLFVRYENLLQTDDRTAIGAGNTSADGHEIRAMWNNSPAKQAVFTHGSGWVASGSPGPAAVLTLAGQQGYLNGKAWSSGGGTTLTSNSRYAIGAKATNFNNGRDFGFVGNILAVAIYDHPLLPAQVWQRSMMLEHLDNPQWNVWARARQWWFVPALPPSEERMAKAVVAGVMGVRRVSTPIMAGTIGAQRALAPTAPVKGR